MNNTENTNLKQISVIVPVYNTLAYLPICVKSLQQQTYPKLEILLVDDGSTDGSGELCDSLAKADSRIRVFHKENGGSSSARNLGIRMAQGDYLGFVDSDDYVEPFMYEKLYQAVTQYHTEIAQIGREEIDEQKRRLSDICVPPQTTECIGAEAFLQELLMHRGDCSFCTKLVEKSLLAEKQFPTGVLNEDFHLLVQLLEEKDRKIVSLPDRGYHVFYRMGSNSRKVGEESFSRVYQDNVDNADMVYSIVEENYPSLKPAAFRFGIFQRLDYLLHIPISRMTRENTFYRSVVSYLRKHWFTAMCNPVLTAKNKCYHTLFAIAPRGIRKIHRKLRKKGR